MPLHTDLVKSTGKPLMHGTGSSLVKSIDLKLLDFAQGLGSEFRFQMPSRDSSRGRLIDSATGPEQKGG